ncbi:MAG TPA: LacI family DNA-binding transcriptional regulator [Roseiarcus sp.]|jgi:LacI family transcriptional regulator
MPTIKDVAAKAGVSTATVSHVVNDTRPVNAETKRRVKAAIKALNYRPHGIARSLRVSQTGAIAVVISDVANPFFAEFVRGVEDTARERGDGYNLLLCNTDESAARERRSLDLVLDRRIDGLVMAPAGGNELLLADLVESGLPVVFGDRKLKGVPVDTVVVDNVAAARDLTQHLLSLGHRRLGLLEADLASSAIHERSQGFREALAEAGVELALARVARSASTVAAAEAVAQRLINLPERPDAVFCTNNFMTLGMTQAILNSGLACPEDVAVAGFDDFPWAAAFRPRLTVMAQPAYEIGREAATLLFDRIAGRRTGAPVQMTLNARLIVRDSCGAHLTRKASPAPALSQPS